MVRRARGGDDVLYPERVRPDAAVSPGAGWREVSQAALDQFLCAADHADLAAVGGGVLAELAGGHTHSSNRLLSARLHQLGHGLLESVGRSRHTETAHLWPPRPKTIVVAPGLEPGRGIKSVASHPGAGDPVSPPPVAGRRLWARPDGGASDRILHADVL